MTSTSIETRNGNRVDAEIQSFSGLWAGGYYEGDPLDPHSRSSYSSIDERHGYPAHVPLAAQEIGFVSVLYATYLVTIRTWLRPGMTVLEVGPGRGAWTKAMLARKPEKIYALDALSAEHNGFWEYVGAQVPVDYHQVEDFDCGPVPDGSVDFFFSFGAFCHISRRGTEAYFKAAARKMKPGARGFCMISDYRKGARAFGGEPPIDADDLPSPGRWYDLGQEWFCDMLRTYGFKILDEDLEVCVRDPVISFER